MQPKFFPIALLFGSLLATPYIAAQTTNATIVGDVTDASGGALPGATITVKHVTTGVTRSVITDELGAFRVFPLNPGTYEVSASMPGFKTKIQPNVILEAAATVKVNLQLEVGEITETIEVLGSSPILQSQDASVGGTVTSSELARLPVNGRNYTRLILLMPGTSDQAKSQRRGTVSGTMLISVNGQRAQDNNFTLDGVDNNMMMMNSPGGSPPMDSIQEFRVLTNTSAEFGRSAGANVNIVTKSGSRDLHGSFYEYLRNDKFDANDFFANRERRGKVPFKQNQYGFSLGGPVVIPKLFNGRESTFWFFNWEGFRFRRGTTLIGTVPIEAQRRGDFSQQARKIYNPFTSRRNQDGTLTRDPFPNNKIPETLINPAIKFFIDTMFPLPNRPGLSNNYVNTQSTSNDRDLWTVRVDHALSGTDNLLFRYTHQNVGQASPNANPNLYAESRFDTRNLAATWNHSFGPTTVLEIKFGYNNPNDPGATLNRKIDRVTFLERSGMQMYQKDVLFSPIPSLSAVGEFGAGGGGSITRDDTYQTVASYSRVMGKHFLKFGVNFSRRHFFTNTSNPMNGNADFDRRLTSLDTDKNSGHSFATMLLGTPTQIRRGQGNTLTQGRQNATNLFIQNDWRATKKLTVNLGLRYEYNNPLYDLTDRLGNLWVQRDPQTGRTFGTLLWASTNPEVDPETGLRNQPPKRLHFGRALMSKDWNNFAPRVGLAYQLDQKTVIRSGFGVFYNSTFVQELQDLRKFWPYTVQQVFVANNGVKPDLFITDPGPSFSNTAAIGGWPQNPDNRTPYSQQWNLFIQRELMKDLALDVGYVGSSNKKQVGYTAINAARPGPGPVQSRRLMPEFGDLDGGSNAYGSNYHALQTKLVRRFSGGLQVNANYTWARAMDDQSSLAEWKTQDMYNKRADYSRSSFDVRHMFQLAYIYELPFGKGRKFGGSWNGVTNFILGGWAVEGITRIQTGAPINVLTGQDRASVGRTYQRPNLIRDPNKGAKTPDEWFDAGAFELPPRFQFGNAGAYIVEADGRHIWDVALHKVFFIREDHRLEFRSEFFNMPNMIQLGNPNGNFSSSAFGQVRSATDARQIQFGLRYAF